MVLREIKGTRGAKSAGVRTAFVPNAEDTRFLLDGEPASKKNKRRERRELEEKMTSIGTKSKRSLQLILAT